MGILVGGGCRVAGTFRGEHWGSEACSSCRNWVTGTACHVNAGALVCNCPVVSWTFICMNMDVGSPSGSWYSVTGITQGLFRGDGALFGSWCHIVAAIPGKHLKAAVVSSAGCGLDPCMLVTAMHVALKILAQLVRQWSFHSDYQSYDSGVGQSWSL